MLVVDDNQDDLDIARGVLEEAGISCDVAPNSDTAVAMIREIGFSIIFMDWKLVGKSGLDALNDLKAACAECIIIVLTGVVTDGDSATALTHGAAAVMSKPITIEHVKLIFGLPKQTS